MTDTDFVLSGERRDEMLKALKAIGRQVKDMPVTAPNPDHQAFVWVVGNNLAMIQTCLTNLPQATST